MGIARMLPEMKANDMSWYVTSVNSVSHNAIYNVFGCKIKLFHSLYARQRNYKKTECLRRGGYISPLRSAYPLNLSYPLVHVGSYGRRNHSCTISAQPVQGLGSYGNPKFPISYT